ncbi:MAG: helix-turn-helix domain-containing protein [Pseudomonas sp.]|uniref:helix-turn-helix domain-containing protein n=1 Tax=Pseudomonas sp. TaxID=306 RepID=UPI003397FB89
MNNKSTAAVLARLKLVTECTSDTSLAEALGVSPQTLSSWKSRDSVPYSFCVDVASAKGVSLDWLIMGEGPQQRGETLEYPQGSEKLHTTPREDALLALFRELPENQQREIQSAAEEKKRLRDIEQRLNELIAALADIKRPA